MVGYFPLEFRILRFGILYKRNPNPISKWFTERESFTLFGELNLKIKLYLVAYVNLFRCDLNDSGRCEIYSGDELCLSYLIVFELIVEV